MRRGARRTEEKKPKREKFDFEKMKLAATHEDSLVRKQVFIDYFERFDEFPSYLFDNEAQIDDRLRSTINDLLNDPDTTKALRSGIDLLLRRLPSTP
jgi:hypothetical protein